MVDIRAGKGKSSSRSRGRLSLTGCEPHGRWLPGRRRRGTVRDDRPGQPLRRPPQPRKGCGRAAGRQLARGRVRRERDARYGRAPLVMQAARRRVRMGLRHNEVNPDPDSLRAGVRRALEVAESSPSATRGVSERNASGSWYTRQQSGDGAFAVEPRSRAAFLAPLRRTPRDDARPPSSSGNTKTGQKLFIARLRVLPPDRRGKSDGRLRRRPRSRPRREAPTPRSSRRSRRAATG